MNNIHHIKKCFNHAAISYDSHSDVQKKIGENLLLLLHPYLDYQKNMNMIDLGCGTGYITEKLAKFCLFEQFYAIDIADQLLLKAQERLKPYPIKIMEEDFSQFSYPDCLFDVIVSNMALHWSKNLKETLAHIYSQMKNLSLLTFSIPLQHTFKELPKTTKDSFYSPNAIKELLINQHFDLLKYQQQTITLSFDHIYSAIKSIKLTGTHYHKNRSLGLQGKNYLKNLNHSPFLLTYEIGCFLARKK